MAALDAGVHAQGKKLLEEAGEVWLAAEHEPDDALAEEISQLLYRAQVIMIGRGLNLADVYKYLEAPASATACTVSLQGETRCSASPSPTRGPSPNPPRR